MAFIEWSDEMSIGVEIFDNEHKHLVAIMNELHDAFIKGMDRPALERICDKLIEYTVLHFRHEEMYFDDWNYPDKLAHITSHRQLRRQVFDYRDRLVAQPSLEMASEIFEFLGLWLTQHILQEDRKYGAFLIERGLR